MSSLPEKGKRQHTNTLSGSATKITYVNLTLLGKALEEFYCRARPGPNEAASHTVTVENRAWGHGFDAIGPLPTHSPLYPKNKYFGGLHLLAYLAWKHKELPGVMKHASRTRAGIQNKTKKNALKNLQHRNSMHCNVSTIQWGVLQPFYLFPFLARDRENTITSAPRRIVLVLNPLPSAHPTIIYFTRMKGFTVEISWCRHAPAHI